jgi:phage tail sheath protein FI
MSFQLSPGVAVVEKDFSAIIPAVSTSAGAFAGAFTWGPVLDPVTITSENNLVSRFGKPTDDSAQSFFTAANFLAYTNNLLVVRADTANHRNAVASGTAVKINNFDDYIDSYASGSNSIGEWAAKYPGILGNSIKVSMADSNTWNPIVNDEDFVVGTTYVIASLGDTNWNAVAGTVGRTYGVGDSFVAADTDVGTGTAYAPWTYQNEFDSAPSTSAYATNNGSSNDEVHVVVVDTDGKWTGTAGTVLEKFAFVSKASDAKKSDGSNNYYKDVINSQSKYVWWTDHTTGVLTSVAGVGTSGVNWGTATGTGVGYKDLEVSVTITLSGGVDDLTATDGQLQSAYAIFANAEQYDISLIPLGKASATVATYVINNVAEVRLDCVAFVSPQDISTGDIIVGSGSDAVDALVAYRNALPSSSYAVLDTGYKYQYDRYNDKYRYVPLNGDVAGLCARTDYTNDPWWSPGGLNRGQVKNVVKLAVNPGKAERDTLYKSGVNPVVNFPGQGSVLFGDKTLLAKPSAFDRINVRRLFIVLEKAIATAAKFQLFEFNDEFTRAQFKNLVEPFLRDVQGRRGVTDFRVNCDDTNNTGEVIDRNEFVADIYIKPNRSINFITLTFVAARSSVNFSEIGA